MNRTPRVSEALYVDAPGGLGPLPSVPRLKGLARRFLTAIFRRRSKVRAGTAGRHASAAASAYAAPTGAPESNPAGGGSPGSLQPTLIVFSTLFPSAAQPFAGLFIRERMFRVGQHLPIVVVAPQPWFPFQGLIRLFFPGYRPRHSPREVQDGVEVLFPRFFSLPGVLRRLDGFSMAVCALPLMRRLRRERGQIVIDAHFAYPNGYAATLLGRWLRVPATITLRGTETSHFEVPALRKRVIEAVREANRVFSVSDSLRRLLVEAGVHGNRIKVIGNGVDLEKFRAIDRAEARRRLGLPRDAKILVSVGGLVERKGFHRVIEILPRLLQRWPSLRYLIVGGASPAGDMSDDLRRQVIALGLEKNVVFLGQMEPKNLHVPLSAADLFVLATRHEGWANVFLEAMACGLPVVTTRVGGNAQVIPSPELGMLVPFGDPAGLARAIDEALERSWDVERILAYARSNDWGRRVETLLEEFRGLMIQTSESRE